MPQDYLASGDAYTRRYDEVIKDVPRKVKIVDDTLLYESNIEGAFFHTFDFLLHCTKNGIEKTRSLTALKIREYWEARHRLSVDDGLVLLDHRIIIPTSQRANVQRSLHSAHQGEVGMKTCANESVY